LAKLLSKEQSFLFNLNDYQTSKTDAFIQSKIFINLGYLNKSIIKNFYLYVELYYFLMVISSLFISKK